MKKTIVIVILPIIWIILVGTIVNFYIYASYIYGSNTPDTATSEERHFYIEAEGFNASFTPYQGKQTGSQVKALINRLIANANTYKEEPERIPSVSYDLSEDPLDKAMCYSNTACIVDKENDTALYNKYLNELSRHLDLKHEYYVSMALKYDELVNGITISYDVHEKDGNFEKYTVLPMGGVKVLDLNSFTEIINDAQQEMELQENNSIEPKSEENSNKN